MYKLITLNVVLVILTSCLIGCSEKQQEFKPEFSKENKLLGVVVIPHNSRRSLIREYNEWVGDKYSLPNNVDKMGWATWTDNTCTIHIDKSLNTNDYIETLGHEYAHCLYGRFHK